MSAHPYDEIQGRHFAVAVEFRGHAFWVNEFDRPVEKDCEVNRARAILAAHCKGFGGSRQIHGMQGLEMMVCALVGQAYSNGFREGLDAARSSAVLGEVGNAEGFDLGRVAEGVAEERTDFQKLDELEKEEARNGDDRSENTEQAPDAHYPANGHFDGNFGIEDAPPFPCLHGVLDGRIVVVGVERFERHEEFQSEGRAS